METIEKLKNALPRLEAKIKEITGINIELYANVSKNRDDEDVYQIYSDDLSDKLCGLSAPIFKTIIFQTWGGIINKENAIVFFPQVQYTHYSGGSNGTDYIWNMIKFDITKSEWSFRLMLQNN
jgi:hypothetical protein